MTIPRSTPILPAATPLTAAITLAWALDGGEEGAVGWPVVVRDLATGQPASVAKSAAQPEKSWSLSKAVRLRRTRHPAAVPEPQDLALSSGNPLAAGSDLHALGRLGAPVANNGTNSAGYVRVLSLGEDLVKSLNHLIEEIITLPQLQGNNKRFLVKKLEAAVKVLEDDKPENDSAACGALQAFINSVQAQSGHQISAADAAALIAEAQQIRAQLGC